MFNNGRDISFSKVTDLKNTWHAVADIRGVIGVIYPPRILGVITPPRILEVITPEHIFRP